MPDRLPATIRWPDAMTGPWTIRLHFRRMGGREECVGFEIWGGSPEGAPGTPLPFRPVRAADIRRPPFGELVDRSRRAAVEQARLLLASQGADEITGEANLLPVELERLLEERVEAFGGGQPIGRPKRYGPDFYAEVASLYRAAWKETGQPLVAIQEKWNVSKSAAAKWVATCRSLDLLPPTERGIARIEEENQ